MEGLSIIVPAYQEEGAVALTLESLIALKGRFDVPVEIMLIDDGSSDRTSEIASGFKGVTVIRKDRNAGYGAAIKTGLNVARYDWTAITDADGSYPNDRLIDLFALRGNADMIVGARTGENVTYSKIRKIPKVFMRYYMVWIAKQDIPDINSGLRIFRTDVAQRFRAIYPDGFSLTTTITLAFMCNSYRVLYEPIDYYARIGSSHIKPVRDTVRFFQLIVRTGLYFAPLRLFTPVSFFFFVLFFGSFFYDLFILSNIADKTILLFTFAFNLGVFGALADMIRKTQQID